VDGDSEREVDTESGGETDDIEESVGIRPAKRGVSRPSRRRRTRKRGRQTRIEDSWSAGIRATDRKLVPTMTHIKIPVPKLGGSR